MTDNSEFLFEDDNIVEEPTHNSLLFDSDKREPVPMKFDYRWKIMVVDDEPEVHRITKLVLSKFKFEGKALNILSAYSAKEAKILIKDNIDTALILLDVVMEEDDAGLKVAKYIREELNNKLIRIVLRTGQPGQAPEESVIVDYDINDYKDKTELTSQKLFTEVVSSLRAYRDLSIIETNRLGLQNILDAYQEIFKIDNIKEYTYSMLQKLSEILGSNNHKGIHTPSGFAAIRSKGDFYIISAVGKFQQIVDKMAGNIFSNDVMQDFETAIKQKTNIFHEDRLVIYLKSKLGTESIVYFEEYSKLSFLSKSLIEVFCKNISVVNEAIINRSRYESEKEQRQLAETLHDFNQKITSTFDMNEVLRTLMNGIAKSIECDVAAIILKNNSTYRISSCIGGCKYIENSIIDKESYEYALMNLLEDKKIPLLIDDVHNCIYLFKNGICEEEMCSLLALPILHKEDVLGAVLLWRNEHAGFRRKEKDLAVTFISQAVAALVNARLFSEVENRRAEVKNLLNNAGQGFLSFGEDLLIDNEYSCECERIFKTKLAGKNITELLFKELEERQFWENAIKSVFREHVESKREIIMSLLHKEILINDFSVELEYKLMHYGITQKMMIILTDITIKKKLENEVENERKTLQMVVNVVKHHDDFINTIKDFQIFCSDSMSEVLSNSKSLENAIVEIFRSIHTYKGIFSQLGIFNVTSKLHNFENCLHEIKHGARMKNLVELEAFILSSNIVTWLDKDLHILSSILGEQFMYQDRTITVKQSKLLEIEEQIMTLGSSEECQKLLMKIKQLRYKPFRELLISIPEYFTRMADRAEKLIKPFEIEGGHFLVDINKYNNFVKSLPHVFRNAIDHGLETYEERIQLNKEESGTISCKIQLEGETILILISDDGRGINIEKVKAHAINSGRYSKASLQRLSEEEILMLIFEDDFSITEKVTDFSGRGYGLSAVKNEIDRLGGTIKIKTMLNRGTTFKFYIPYCQ